MGEGSVDQAVECRLMSGVRRGAHDLDLEAFGNVTRIGVRDIRRRVLLAVLNLDHTQAVVQYPLAILVADYKLQRCLVRIVELMRLRFFAVVLCDIRRGLDGHVVFPRLIQSRRFRPVERLALRVVDQVVVFRPAAGRADVLYLNLPDSRFQIVIGGSGNKRGLRIFCFPDRVEGRVGSSDLDRAIRLICGDTILRLRPALEYIILSGRGRCRNVERCLAGVGLGSLRSRCAFAAVSVVVKDVGFFGHRLVMGDVDVNGSIFFDVLPLVLSSSVIPRYRLESRLIFFEVMLTNFSCKFGIICLKVFVRINRHCASPRIIDCGHDGTIVRSNFAKRVCAGHFCEIIKPCTMIIQAFAAPHINSALGGAGRVDIVAEALYVRYGGLVGFLNLLIEHGNAKCRYALVPFFAIDSV